jgi:hypothetical protein
MCLKEPHAAGRVNDPKSMDSLALFRVLLWRDFGL